MNLLRAGVNPTAVKSNVSAVDLSSLIDYELADRSWGILAQLFHLAKEMQSLILNFWTTVEHSVSAHEVTTISTCAAREVVPSGAINESFSTPELIPINTGFNAICNFDMLNVLLFTVNAVTTRSIDSVVKTTDIILHLLGEASLSKNVLAAPCYDGAEHDIYPEKLHTYRATHMHQLSTTLSTALSTSYGKLKSLQSSLLSTASVLDDTLLGVYGICTEMDSIISRARFAAALSSNVTPAYCSWVKRTVGFSKYDKSVGSFKTWAVIINNALFFLQQPYSPNVRIYHSLFRSVNSYLPCCRLIW
jgi:hypothetical protein